MDGSNYFRGLLLLIRKDRNASHPEIELMKRIGKALGFETEFCNNAIDEILENKFIVDEPPQFSTKELARKFITDGLTLAASDKEIHPSEEQWLKSTVEKNGLQVEWFLQERENATKRKGHYAYLEVDELTVEYS
jgi:hypothetical protein